MLKSRKHVFWEALLVAFVIFVFGFLVGYALEASRIDQLQGYYIQSEVSVTDGLAFVSLADIENANCDVLIDSTMNYADSIFQEAKLLQQYEESGRLDDDIKLIHKKYDLLRTFLWINSLKIQEKCPSYDFTPVVYLYEYDTADLTKKAEQTVWSKVLGDFKNAEGSKIVLIPLAVDLNLNSLNFLVAKYNIQQFPAVIINDNIVYDVESAVDLGRYLN